MIHGTFKHGKNFKIGNFCTIEENVIVGDNVKIDNYVLLKKGTWIGDNVWIDSYVRSSGDNIISDRVTLRFGCTIAKMVVIHAEAFISPNVMTIYSTHEHKSRGSTVIGKKSFIGTAAVIGPGINIGKNVIIGAMSNVTKNCSKPGIYVGNPARKIK